MISLSSLSLFSHSLTVSNKERVKESNTLRFKIGWWTLSNHLTFLTRPTLFIFNLSLVLPSCLRSGSELYVIGIIVFNDVDLFSPSFRSQLKCIYHLVSFVPASFLSFKATHGMNWMTPCDANVQKKKAKTPFHKCKWHILDFYKSFNINI